MSREVSLVIIKNAFKEAYACKDKDEMRRKLCAVFLMILEKVPSAFRVEVIAAILDKKSSEEFEVDTNSKRGTVKVRITEEGLINAVTGENEENLLIDLLVEEAYCRV